jgi:hypothetical protein
VAISFVGSAGANAASVTIPAHSVGDLLIIVAYNPDAPTIPSLPAGWTSLATKNSTTFGVGARVGKKIATSTSDASGTWTNADQIAAAVYHESSGGTLSTGVVGTPTISAGPGADVVFPGIASLTDADGTSWVAAIAAVVSQFTTDVETPPAGLVNRADQNGTGGDGNSLETVIHDTDGGVTSWASHTKTTTGSGTNVLYIGFSVEIVTDAATLTNKTLDATTAGSYATAGTDATLKHGYAVQPAAGAYLATGTAALLKHGYAVQASAGAISYSGAAASLLRNAVLAGGAGAFAIGGQAATLLLKRVLAAGVGAYALAGVNAVLRHGYAAQADAGAYNFTGTAATLRHAGLILVDPGAFAITGAAVGLFIKRILAAEPAAYAVSGADARLLPAHRLAPSAGAYSVAGADAALIPSTRTILQADVGAYAISGTNAAVVVSHRMAPTSGAFTITGAGATLTNGTGESTSPTDWLITARRRHNR